jgi:hypothetical protein
MGTPDMTIIPSPGIVTYIADTGDWRLVVGESRFEIQPQVGGLEYSSGMNLDNLAALIVEAKVDALARGVNWSGN